MPHGNEDFADYLSKDENGRTLNDILARIKKHELVKEARVQRTEFLQERKEELLGKQKSNIFSPLSCEESRGEEERKQGDGQEISRKNSTESKKKPKPKIPKKSKEGDGDDDFEQAILESQQFNKEEFKRLESKKQQKSVFINDFFQDIGEEKWSDFLDKLLEITLSEIPANTIRIGKGKLWDCCITNYILLYLLFSV